MSFGPLSDLIFGAPCPPTRGKKGVTVRRVGSYSYYALAKRGDLRRATPLPGEAAPIYDAAAVGGGWRRLNKPTSARDRHRAAVEVMRRVPERALILQAGAPSSRSEHEKMQAAQRARQERRTQEKLRGSR